MPVKQIRFDALDLKTKISSSIKYYLKKCMHLYINNNFKIKLDS